MGMKEMTEYDLLKKVDSGELDFEDVIKYRKVSINFLKHFAESLMFGETRDFVERYQDYDEEELVNIACEYIDGEEERERKEAEEKDISEHQIDFVF